MASSAHIFLVILAIIPLITGSQVAKLDWRFCYKYQLLADLSVDNYQGEEPDANEVTLLADLAITPAANPDLWSLQLSSVNVQGEGKKTEIQEKCDPLYVRFNDQGVEYYINPGHHAKEGSFSNILKSVANLFSSHSNTQKSCSVRSEDIDGQTVQIFTDCDGDKELNKHSTHPLGIKASVNKKITYKLGKEGIVEEISSWDDIDYYLVGNSETKSRITSNLKLKLVKKEEIKAKDETKELMKSLKKLDSELFKLPRCDEAHCSKLKEFVEFRKDDYDKSKLGSDTLALSTLTTILNSQPVSEKDVKSLLTSKKVKPVRGQILDILGALQTFEVYSGVMTTLLDHEEDADDLERYLQTLAVGLRPCKGIMEDILKRLTKDKFKQEKIRATLIMTLSSMAHNHAQTPNFSLNLIDSIDTFLWEHFMKCKDLECSAEYLRGYLNLRLVNRIPDLLIIVQKQHKVLGTIAMKALQHFPLDAFSEKSQNILHSIFHQTIRRFDSSIRTLALDILMKGEMDLVATRDLLQVLKHQEKSYEVKQYLLERFKLRAGECEEFQRTLTQVLMDDSDLNNYHRIATGGLTTALSRQFLKYPSFNSSIMSVQEIQKGVLKRGIVDMFFTGEEREKYSYFTLELYARGMANMMGGGGEADEGDNEEETLTAGMELIVHGQSLRPLQFFSGQGELMGHVWSGTASDPTPAYQATTLFFDHRFEVPLLSGFTVQFDILTAISIDLNGQVTLSLWNRNGKSKVEQNVGFATVGRITVVTDFSRTVNEFRVLQNPKLNLISDFSFSGDNILCMQVTQPDITLNKTYWKKNAIPALKISNEMEKHHSYKIAGNSHLLNAKNNEMCRAIHNEL